MAGRKNITLSADEELIKEARQRAQEMGTTLNEAFRDWLCQFTRPAVSRGAYQEVMHSLRHIRAGRTFSRDELNER